MTKTNYIIIAVAVATIIIGLLLMTGNSSGVEFNPDIFSFRRITLAPIVTLTGFLLVVVGIMYKGNKK